MAIIFLSRFKSFDVAGKILACTTNAAIELLRPLLKFLADILEIALEFPRAAGFAILPCLQGSLRTRQAVLKAAIRIIRMLTPK